MRYTTFEMAGDTYKLRLSASAIENLENKIGDNPLNVALSVQSGGMPKVSKVLAILQASMQQFHKGVTPSKMNQLYDAYVDDGNSLMDLIPVLLDVFRVSGFLPQETAEDQDDQSSD